MAHRAITTVTIGLVAAVLLTAAPLLAADRSDHVKPDVGMHHYTTSDAMVDVVDGPNDGHDATIDTRLYVPNNASAANPQPALLMTHGFGLAKDAAEVTSAADFYARHGYLVLTWTAQGFGKSSGCVRLNSFDYDVKDVRQLIEKVLDPRDDVLRDKRGLVLGMLGGSYGGGITLNAAAVEQQIRALAAGRTWNSLQYSLAPNNLIRANDPTGFRHQSSLQGVFKQEWTTLFFISGNAEPFGGAPPDGTSHGGCPQEKLTSGDPVQVAGLPCIGFPSEVCRTFAQVSTTGNAVPSDRALLENSSVQTKIGRLKAATLLIQGESDTLFNTNDALATYTELRRRDVPVAMTWNYGGHGGYNSQPGECETYGGGHEGLDDCYLSLRTLRWFNHYLRGKPLGDFPGFTYFRDWVDHRGSGANDEQYGVAKKFPAQSNARFSLTPSGGLAAPGRKPPRGALTFRNPPGGLPASYSETSNFTGPEAEPSLGDIPPFDPPGQSASFTSKPFTRNVVSVGAPSAHLNLSHSGSGDLVFFGKVFDVAPDGSTKLIKRLVAPVRVPAGQVDEPVDIKLIGFAHRFRKGHSVRLTLASTDQTSYNVKQPDTITVRTGGADPSTFSLPVSSRSAIRREPPRVVSGGPPECSCVVLPATGLSTVLPLAALALLSAAVLVRRRRPARRSP